MSKKFKNLINQMNIAERKIHEDDEKMAYRECLKCGMKFYTDRCHRKCGVCTAMDKEFRPDLAPRKYHGPSADNVLDDEDEGG